MDILSLIIFLAVFLIDQASKQVISLFLSHSGECSVVPGLLSFRVVKNTGMAFGLFNGGNVVFILTTLIVIAILVVILKRDAKSRPERVAIAFVLGGALGNLCDRIRLGYVVDFLDFHIWPVFNIADSAITIGTVLLISIKIRLMIHKENINA